MKNDQRGRVGEARFEAACSSSRGELAAVRATPDLHGWDYHVTLTRLADGATRRVETSQTERDCKVQVKTVLPHESTVSVSLSNAERMAKEPSPWFLVAYRFPKDSTTPMEVFLVHFGIEMVSLVYERLRKYDLNPNPRKTKINKVKIKIPFGESERLPDETFLRSRIEGFLGASAMQYAQEKEKWKASVGFGERPFTLKFTTTGASQAEIEERFVDWAIGLGEDRLAIEASRGEDVRFGMPRELQGLERAAFLSLPKKDWNPDSEVTIAVVGENTRVGLPTLLRRAREVLPWLPAKQDKYHFEGRFLSFVLKGDPAGEKQTANILFRLPMGDERVPLAPLRAASKAVRLLVADPPRRLLISIVVDGKTVYSGESLGVNSEGYAEIREQSAIFLNACFVADHAELDISNTWLKPKLIMAYGGFLETLVRCLRGEAPVIESFKGVVFASDGPGLKAVCIPCVVPFDTYVVAGIVTFEGNPTSVDGGSAVRFENVTTRLRGELLVRPAADWSLDGLRAEVARVVDLAARDGVECAVPKFVGTGGDGET